MFPERRPIDNHLSMCAFATMEAMIGELAAATPNYGLRSPDVRHGEISRAFSPLFAVLVVQRRLSSDQELARDDRTIGYVHGFADAFGHHYSLDHIQRITLVVTTMRMLYGLNNAVEYYWSIWNGAEESPRRLASRIGKQEALEFLKSGKPPLGLCDRGDESSLEARSPAAAQAQAKPTGFDISSSSSPARAVEECRKIVHQQIPTGSKIRLDTAYARGYLLGVVDGVCQARGVGEAEAIVVTSLVFCTYFGDEQGLKLMQYTMQVGERSISHQARLVGGQEAIDHHNAGRPPRGLREHLETKVRKSK